MVVEGDTGSQLDAIDPVMFSEGSEALAPHIPTFEGYAQKIQIATETGEICAQCVACPTCPIFKLKQGVMMEVTVEPAPKKTQKEPVAVSENISPIIITGLHEAPERKSEPPKPKDGSQSVSVDLKPVHTPVVPEQLVAQPQPVIHEELPVIDPVSVRPAGIEITGPQETPKQMPQEQPARTVPPMKMETGDEVLPETTVIAQERPLESAPQKQEVAAPQSLTPEVMPAKPSEAPDTEASLKKEQPDDEMQKIISTPEMPVTVPQILTELKNVIASADLVKDGEPPKPVEVSRELLTLLAPILSTEKKGDFVVAIRIPENIVIKADGTLEEADDSDGQESKKTERQEERIMYVDLRELYKLQKQLVLVVEKVAQKHVSYPPGGLSEKARETAQEELLWEDSGQTTAVNVTQWQFYVWQFLLAFLADAPSRTITPSDVYVFASH